MVAATIEAARPPAEAPELCEACAAPEEATPREALYGPMLDFILDELQATKLLRQGESHVDSAAQRFLVDLRAELLRDLEGIMTERSQAFNTDDTAALIVDQYLVSGAPITPLRDGKAEWYAVKINVFTPRARGRAAAFERDEALRAEERVREAGEGELATRARLADVFEVSRGQTEQEVLGPDFMDAHSFRFFLSVHDR